MNIKGLLIGSTAALVAVSGARAADAIIAEPEPVEYVRVCDAYGAGFFYIPGTETCLQVSGYVWYQVGAEGYDDEGDTPSYNYGVGPSASFTSTEIVGTVDLPEDGILDDDITTTETDFLDGFLVTSRARVNFDARSDTEWGTLRAYIRYQAEGTSVQSDIQTAADEAFIDLGGIRMGYTESAWYETRNSASSYGSHAYNDLYVAYQQRQILSYSFGGDTGLFGTISLEDDSLAGEGFIPDAVGLIGYGFGFGTVWAKVGYDEEISGDSDEALDFDGDDEEDGYAVTIGTQIPIGPEGSSLRVLGYYADSDNTYGTSGPTFTNSEFSIIGSYNYVFSPTLSASIGGQYFDNFYLDGTDIDTDDDGYAIVGSIVWVPITNFEIRAEVNYDEVEDLDGTTSGYLRFTRYF